jgi:solute carrier family 25 folate transporter 32
MATLTSTADTAATPKRGLGWPSMLVEATSGLVAGALSTLVVHPLDLVKTRLQSTFPYLFAAAGLTIAVDRSDHSRRLGASWRVASEVWRKEGSGAVGGLYRGLGANATGNMVSWGLYFLLFVPSPKTEL